MKKFWMMLAVAGLFSATVVSCGEKKEEEKTEAAPTEEAAPAAEETAAPTEEAAPATADTAAAPATEEAAH
jgi:hypothetical protein